MFLALVLLLGRPDPRPVAAAASPAAVAILRGDGSQEWGAPTDSVETQARQSLVRDLKSTEGIRETERLVLVKSAGKDISPPAVVFSNAGKVIIGHSRTIAL